MCFEPIYTEAEKLITGYKVNVRDSDRKELGVVSDRYKIIQNNEAFAFTDELLGERVRYETAGSLQGGKKVWLLAHMPMNMLFLVNELVHIYYFQILMMATVQSRWH